MLKSFLKPHPLKVLQVLTLMVFSVMGMAAQQEKINVSGASIRSGYSLRVPRYGYGALSCRIENGDKVPHNVSIKLIMEDGFGQSQNNLFTESLAVPAFTSMNYESPVMLESSERCRIEAFVDGKRLSGTDQQIIVKLLSGKDIQIGILNDDTEASFGPFVQLPEYKDKYFSVDFSAETCPSEWFRLKDLTALIVTKPDLQKYSSSQFQAILDYVYQGGTIIFAEPETALKAAKTPLAELLPVIPLRIRRIGNLTELKKLIPSFKGWPAHDAIFLESESSGDGFDILREGDYPLFRWKKYGLGSARFSAISLAENNFSNKQVWEKLVEEFFKHQAFFLSEDSFSECLDEMTGFPVPGTWFIKLLLAIYFSTFGGLAAWGLWKRKSAEAWLAATGVAFIMTFFILVKAETVTGKKGKILSSVKIKYAGGTSEPSINYCSFFADRDMLLSIGTGLENVSISTIPPSKASLLPSGISMMAMNSAQYNAQGGSAPKIKSPMEILRKNGTQSIENLKIPTKTSRQFKVSSTGPGTPLDESTGPSLSYSDRDITFSWGKLDATKKERAFLLFQDGIVELSRKSGSVPVDMAKSSFIETDAVARTLRDAIESGMTRNAPCVALVTGSSSSNMQLPANTFIQGKNIEIIPVTENSQAPTINIPAQEIVLVAADTSTRMVMPGNRILNFMESRGALLYMFKFTLPPAFSRITPEEITVNLQYRNQGGNINVRPLISKNGEKIDLMKKSSKYNPLSEALKATDVAGNLHTFRGTYVSGAINPFTGSGYIVIDAVEKNPNVSMNSKIKANAWAPVSISVSVKGKLPGCQIPFKY
ncbi:MAG: hypothetical protein A2020_14955 [Lentisphaerae bacterium GWF2_45_14]|nr:MAG: hypothetical protein A2020_14955 [Lentisphaerae bacterium GWF2_45_14]